MCESFHRTRLGRPAHFVFPRTTGRSTALQCGLDFLTAVVRLIGAWHLRNLAGLHTSGRAKGQMSVGGLRGVFVAAAVAGCCVHGVMVLRGACAVYANFFGVLA